MSFWNWASMTKNDGMKQTRKRAHDKFDTVTTGYGDVIRRGISDNRVYVFARLGPTKE